VRTSSANWRTGASLRRIRSLLWGRVVESKLRDLERALKPISIPTNPASLPATPTAGSGLMVAAVDLPQARSPILRTSLYPAAATAFSWRTSAE
jgi:hypothetical protein